MPRAPDAAYRPTRLALWCAGIACMASGGTLAVLVPAAVHWDPTMARWAAWTVHVFGAVVLVVPGLLGLVVGGWAASQLSGRFPRTSGAKVAIALYLVAGLWPLALWVAWELWRAAPAAGARPGAAAGAAPRSSRERVLPNAAR